MVAEYAYNPDLARVAVDSVRYMLRDHEYRFPQGTRILHHIRQELTPMAMVLQLQEPNHPIDKEYVRKLEVGYWVTRMYCDLLSNPDFLADQNQPKHETPEHLDTLRLLREHYAELIAKGYEPQLKLVLGDGLHTSEQGLTDRLK